jgi:hypothetical protein
MISGAVTNAFDFMTPAQIADVKAKTGLIDVTDAVQDAVDSSGSIYFPEGIYKISKAIQLLGFKNIIGAGVDVTVFSRVNTTPETIEGYSVTALMYASARDVTVKGLSLNGDTNSAIDGIFFGSFNSGSFSDLRIYGCNSGLRAADVIYMVEFNRITCAYTEDAYNFNSNAGKTSLTFNSCWAQNCGNAYLFNQTTYSVLNSCGADYCNCEVPTGGYEKCYGSRDSANGVYNLYLSSLTLNGCAAEYSFGNGFINSEGGFATLNSPVSFVCSSTYEPDYTNYPNYAVGPIQTGSLYSSVTVNNPRIESWTNTYVSTNFPTKPVATLVAFNYDENAYGSRASVMVFATSHNMTGTVFAGHGNVAKYCKQFLTGDLLTSASVIKFNGFNASGSGTTLTIPITSQVTLNTKHYLKVNGVTGTANATTIVPFAFEVSFISLNLLRSITIVSSVGVASITDSGMNLIVTLNTATNIPLVFAEINSENPALVGVTSMTCS